MIVWSATKHIIFLVIVIDVLNELEHFSHVKFKFMYFIPTYEICGLLFSGYAFFPIAFASTYYFDVHDVPFKRADCVMTFLDDWWNFFKSSISRWGTKIQSFRHWKQYHLSIQVHTYCAALRDLSISRSIYALIRLITLGICAFVHLHISNLHKTYLPYGFFRITHLLDICIIGDDTT